MKGQKRINGVKEGRKDEMEKRRVTDLIETQFKSRAKIME